jgi:aromatic-L-amino-acid/L-tryptophan decarboxylase
MSTVCFRARPDAGMPGGERDEDVLREHNRRWLEAVNRSGEAYLSHTELRGRYVLRLAVGNLRTDEERLERTLALLDRHLEALER